MIIGFQYWLQYLIHIGSNILEHFQGGTPLLFSSTFTPYRKIANHLKKSPENFRKKDRSFWERKKLLFVTKFSDNPVTFQKMRVSGGG